MSKGTEIRPGVKKQSNRTTPWKAVTLPHYIKSLLTCFWVDTEGALQQVVHTFTDIDIKPRVTILQHDFFLKVLALLGSALGKKIALWLLVTFIPAFNKTRPLEQAE